MLSINSDAKKISTIILLFTILTLVYSTAHAVTSLEATYTVNTESDSHDVHPGDGICEDRDKKCSLRAAIEEGEGYPPLRFSVYAPNGQYHLTLGPIIIIKKSVSILSSGVIQCGPKTETGISVVNDASLEGEFGGIVECKTALHILEGGTAVISGNIMGNMQAIRNEGYLDMSWIWLGNNSGNGAGAAIANYGTVRVGIGSSFENNHSGGWGGALYNAETGIFKAARIKFIGNTSSKAGGAIYNAGELLLDSVHFEKNTAPTGGAIFNEAASGWKPLLSRCSLIANEATTSKAIQCGGAIHNNGGVLNVVNSTISGNLSNGNGSGVCVTGGDVQLGNVTITKNISNRNFKETGVDGGALFGGLDGGGTLILRNSIVADNESGGDGAEDCVGHIKSEGHNIVGILDKDRCELDEAPEDILGTVDNPIDAGLKLLDQKFTYFHGLNGNSPAIDSANHTSCMAEVHHPDEWLSDQIEIPRDFSGTCDRGSVEFWQ